MSSKPLRVGIAWILSTILPLNALQCVICTAPRPPTHQDHRTCGLPKFKGRCVSLSRCTTIAPLASVNRTSFAPSTFCVVQFYYRNLQLLKLRMINFELGPGSRSSMSSSNNFRDGATPPWWSVRSSRYISYPGNELRSFIDLFISCKAKVSCCRSSRISMISGFRAQMPLTFQDIILMNLPLSVPSMGPLDLGNLSVINEPGSS